VSQLFPWLLGRTDITSAEDRKWNEGSRNWLPPAASRLLALQKLLETGDDSLAAQVIGRSTLVFRSGFASNAAILLSSRRIFTTKSSLQKSSSFRSFINNATNKAARSGHPFSGLIPLGGFHLLFGHFEIFQSH
jgi:hypothetical protein